MLKRLQILTIALALPCACPGVWAEGGPQVFSDWHEPRWVTNLDGFEGSVRTEGLEYVVKVAAVYTYPDGTQGTVPGKPDPDDPAKWHYTIPPAPKAGPGEMTYYVEVLYGMHGTDRRGSQVRRLPLSYAEELDITGEAAEILFYPLPDESHTVRYIPCCNIYGGMTYAERVPVCPAETKAGLPDKLISDFMILEPDGMSASTMGMYFDFKLGEDAMERLSAEDVGLYEIVADGWTEVQTYEVDTETGTVSVHFPTGGMLVVGVKP